MNRRSILRSLLFFISIISVSSKAISQTTYSQHFEFQNDGSLLGKWFKILTVDGGGIYSAVGFSGEALTFDDVATAQRMVVLASVHDNRASAFDAPGNAGTPNIFHSSDKPPLQKLRWVQTANTGTYTGTLELWGQLNADWQNSGVWINWKYNNDGAYTVTWENGYKDAVSTPPTGNGTYWDFAVGQVFSDRGNMGVGTTNPLSKMEVNFGGSQSPAYGLHLTTPTFHTATNAANSYFLKASDAGSGDIPFLVRGDGKVGIGTIQLNDAGYRLFVETGIRTRKVKVDQAAWPDYVFQSTYRLRPLSELEQYIQQHHHLPEVPSAVEVEKDGLNLGDNQSTLLKKIEELTLYVIEQNKINKEQSKRLEQQQREIEALKKQAQKSKRQ